MTLPMKQFGIAAIAALAFAAPASAQTAAKSAQAADKPAATVTTAREASSGMATGREAQSGHASGDKKDVAFPACDGASKDAAKCVAAPPAPGAQAAKRENKVEAISIKQ
ncbi:MAG TPA: hypothetical protein VII58_04570 [Acidobacteriaceae bacterium]